MKNKLLALLASIGLVSSASAIEINENLSINGFIDGSYFDGDTLQLTKASLGMTKLKLNFSVKCWFCFRFLDIEDTSEVKT